jgi:uncharacterized membrane protein YraQ (UPF0718 family)
MRNPSNNINFAEDNISYLFYTFSSFLSILFLSLRVFKMRYSLVLNLIAGFTAALSFDNSQDDLDKRQVKNSGYKMVRADQAASMKEKTWNPPANLKNALDVTWECMFNSISASPS